MRIVHIQNYMSSDDVVVYNDHTHEVVHFSVSERSEANYVAYKLQEMLHSMGFEVEVETVKNRIW